ncbi:unnamed protein product, partial [Ectocarpus sp. 12 AP-2014]
VVAVEGEVPAIDLPKHVLTEDNCTFWVGSRPHTYRLCFDGDGRSCPDRSPALVPPGQETRLHE